MSEPVVPAGGKPKPFAALRVKGARAYLLGTALVMMADSIEHVISYWILYEKFDSPALGGFAVISHWVPFLLFSVYSGALADRFDPRRIIQLGMALFMLASLGWGTLLFVGGLERWHAAVILVVHGMAGVLWAPAGQLLLHDIVGGTQLLSAVRLLAMSRTLGLLLGPAVGGALMLTVGPVAGLMINVLIYLPLVLWLWKAPYGPRFREGGKAAARAIRGFWDIVATGRSVAADPRIVSMIVLGGAASLFVGNAFQAQMPAFARDFGAGSSLRYSMLLSANAAGAVMAGLILELRSMLPARPKTAVVLVALWCVSLAGFAASSSFPVALALLLCAGFFQLSYSSMTQTLVQLHAPAEIRGRVIGLYNMCALGLMSFSGVTVGIGGSLVGVHWSLGASTLALLAVTLTLVPLTLRGRVAAPTAQPADPA